MNAATDRDELEPIDEMRVENPTMALELLAKDAHPMQQYRELTENAIQAIEATPDRSGLVLWDVDWWAVENEAVYRLACIDTGEGMSGDDQVTFINHLFMSGREQGTAGNFGIGAKVTAGARNPHGVVYFSWRDGAGTMSWFCRQGGPGTPYGLKRMVADDGSWHAWLPVDDAARPPEIIDRGTKVVLMGETGGEHTLLPPAGSTAPGMKWLSKYLNLRYFEFPTGVDVRVREFPADQSAWPISRPLEEMSSGTRRRRITGMKDFLDKNSVASDTVVLPDGAEVFWWILEENANSDVYLSRGHTAALFQRELYEVTEGNSHRMRMQAFGVLYSHKRLVVYIKPPEAGLTATTARDGLRISGGPLPWDEWGEAFKARMPPEIKELERKVREAFSEEDHSKSIKERLRQYRKLFKITAFRVQADGSEKAVGESPSGGGGGDGRGGGGGTPGGSGGAEGGSGTRRRDYRSLRDRSGDNARAVSPNRDIPDIDWIKFSTTDYPTDRAAVYARSENKVLANSEFRVFTDMTDRFCDEVGASEPEAQRIIGEAVREWYGQVLVEAVVRSWNFEHEEKWQGQDYEHLTSPEALTMAILPFSFLDGRIRQVVNTRLRT